METVLKKNNIQTFIKRLCFLMVVLLFMSFKKQKDNITPTESSLKSIIIPSYYKKESYYNYLKAKGFQFYDKKNPVSFYIDTLDENYLTYSISPFFLRQKPLKIVEEKLREEKGNLKKVFDGKNHIVYVTYIMENKLKNGQVNDFVFRSNKKEFRYYSYVIISKKENFYLQMDLSVNNYKYKKTKDFQNIIHNFYN
ncbi:hypothetical protein ACLI1A_02210 [Flavobacterium sp. RHBU_3]|uniref:hypothetical protein n=1 Tax=Flavobacterium sp. RHBU_3 TaxID=3391184 RepID=UPI003984B9EE